MIDKVALIIAAVIFAAGVIRFWVSLAQGLSEASEQHQRGFEVKTIRGEVPVPRKEMNDLPDRRSD